MKTQLIRRMRSLGSLLAAANLALTATPLLTAQAPPAPSPQPAVFKELFARALDPNNTFTAFSDLATVFLLTDPAVQEQALAAAAAQVSRETPTTTTQKGAVAESAGSTTLAEKTGLAQFLNLAIEQGAIVKTTSGTSYTLQTTPYLFYSRFGTQDLPSNWRQSALLRQIALSATFNQTSGASDPSRNNFERAEAKYTVGERSARDPAFLDRISKLLDARIDLNTATANLTDFWTQVEKRSPHERRTVESALELWYKQQRDQKKTISPRDLMAKLNEVLAPLRSQLNDDDRARLQLLAANLGVEEQALKAASEFFTAAAKKYIDEPHPSFSFAYAFQRDTTLADFSDLKLLYSYKTSMNLSAELNGEVMINDRRTAVNGSRLERLRGYAFEADLTMGKFGNDTADFTAAAKLTRPTGGLRDERSVQAKLNLYLLRGVTVPVSLSYTNHTDDPNQPSRSHVRVNVGLSMDADALIGAARKSP